jgi:hypothetical protein
MRLLLAATALAMAFGAAEAVKGWTAGYGVQATIQSQDGQSSLTLASGN